MITAITSISPTHVNKDIQHKAVESWITLGMKVISINSQSECDILKPLYKDVTFVPTVRTMELTFGKPLVSVSAIFDYCKIYESDNFCIINSDIELQTDKSTIERIEVKMQDYIVMANRINYETEKVGKKYLLGIDVFFIAKKYINSFPQTMHALGMTFVDYFIPFSATKLGIQTIFIEQDIAYHKEHKQQYSHDNWLKSGRFFLWEFGLYQFSDTHGIGNMSTFVYNYIYNSSVTKRV